MSPLSAIATRLAHRDVALVCEDLRAHEAALVLRCAPSAVNWRLRAGQLPVTWVGRRRRVAVRGLAELVAGDPLAFEALVALAEGRLSLPPATQPQPSLPTAVAAAALVAPTARASDPVSALGRGRGHECNPLTDASHRVALVSDHPEQEPA